MDPLYLQNYPDFRRPNKQRDPNTYSTIRDTEGFLPELYNATIGFLFELYATVTWRIDSIRRNFLRDFFGTKSVFYPLIGLFEFAIYYKFWYYSVLLAIIYTCLFLLVIWVYFTLLFPLFVMSNVFFFGPAGVQIATIQMVLQSNIWTVRGIKTFVSPIFQDDIFCLFLLRKGHLQTIQQLKMRQLPALPELHFNHIEYWIHDVPFNIFSFLRWLVVNIIMVVISVVPVIGPITSNILLTPDRAYSYYDVWMKMRRLSDKAKRDEYYWKLGQLWAYGLMSGFLELIPGFAAIGLISNVIAIGVWAHDDIKYNRIEI